MSIYVTLDLEHAGHQELPASLDPDNEGLVYGQNVGQCGEAGLRELNAIAREAGVTPLTDYVFSFEEEDEAGFFPIPQGLQTLNALIAELERRPDGVPLGRYRTGAILWDLHAYRTVLEAVDPEEDRFRLCAE